MKKHGSTHGPHAQQQPDGAVRSSQMVTTYGPGSMVDLLRDAVLVGGLDFWSYPREFAVPTIDEPRLREAIVRQFNERAAAGGARVELSADQPFRAPPSGNDREPTKFSGVAVAEFPRWFVCQNPSCRQLLQARDGLEFKSHRYWHHCSNGRSKKPSECVPVRFVEACKRGHLDDFRWILFVHELQNKERCAKPELVFDEGASGDFDDIAIRCLSCGAHARLRTAMSGMPMRCRGKRPWLGREGDEECSENVRLLVRTATNSYFSQSMSALSIPDKSKELHNKVRLHWTVLKGANAVLLPAFRTIEAVRHDLEGYRDDEVLDAIRALNEDKPGPAVPIRTAEYAQFTSAKVESVGELPGDDEVFFARRVVAKTPWPDGVANVVVVSKLREVIAQIGFTRLEPVTPDVQGEYDLGVKTASLGLTTNWLPASEIRGEGVFLELDEAKVRAWESRPEVQARGRELLHGYETWRESAESAPEFPGVRFYLLHSLSHLLLSAISLECGYAASAIRERIYCGPSERDLHTPMAGILLSTGTTGSEGTLGGLVEQGRALTTHLRHAWDLGRLCSNDPVCGGHSPERDHAERYLEGAACHGCLFVAECSCERFNRYLDRALVVPTLGHSERVAFFSQRP